MSEKQCRYFLPKELGHPATCLLFGLCNKHGSNCVAFAKHTKATKKALAEAIEIKKEVER